MHRIVFMGTPDFAVPALQKLIETQNVVGVVTQPDRPAGRGQQVRKSPVKIAAETAGLPIYQPQSLRKVEAAEPIRAWEPDAIIVAAFGQILKPHLLDFPRLGCINIHASLLPRWRGASPIQHAILAGDKTSGVCLMHMDVGLDTGDVYACESTELTEDETAQSLHDKLADIGGLLIERDLPAVLNGEITRTPQDETKVTYAGMISKTDGEIDWTDSAETIHRRIRAMTPWPSAYTFWGDKSLKILSGEPVQNDVESGIVTKLESGEIAVGTSNGAVVLHRIQLQGKKAMDVGDFVRGRVDFIGARLGK